MSTKRLHIRVVGPIWQPGFTCASQETLSDGDFDRLDIDPRNPEDIRTYCDTHFGDFSAIDAIDAKYEERGRCSSCGTITRAENTRVLSFTEEQEAAWCDAMFPTES